VSRLTPCPNPDCRHGYLSVERPCPVCRGAAEVDPVELIEMARAECFDESTLELIRRAS
jgi:hypothetical protein